MSRAILIGGSSNVGKSTLAKALANKLGWHYIATDYLARHPGRPWRTTGEPIPSHVAEHYATLSTEELLEDVLRHYQNLQPQIESLVKAHTSDESSDRLVMEGSALWPEFVATWKPDGVTAVWLTASHNLFQRRMYQESQFEKATAEEMRLIQKFLKRTLLYNEQMMESINRLGLASIHVESTSSLDELANKCLGLLSKQPTY